MPRKASPALPRRRLRSADRHPPRYIEPMKALGVTSLAGDDWLLEVKYDGFRALGIKDGSSTELWSRNEKPLTADYPEIAAAVGQLRCRSVIVDGEIVALDADGRPTFQLLQNSGAPGSRAPILYYVFDLLHLDGESLLERPIEERRSLLESILPGAPERLRLSPVFQTDAATLLEQVRQQRLEGIVAKRAGSRYEPGRRSGAWVKQRISLDQEFVIGGYTAPQGGRLHFGALLVGYHEGGALRYAGKVGTGFDAGWLSRLMSRFRALEQTGCPFTAAPPVKAATWLKPSLVCQVKFSEWTRDGILRQPVFLGLREDKRAREVVRETSLA